MAGFSGSSGRLGLGLAAALLLSACAPTLATRGALPDAERLALVREGVSTREDVASVLGTPTLTAAFNENTWYYVGRRTEQYAFLDPVVTEQKAVEVRFDDQGVVQQVRTLDPADSRAIDPVGRRTPTYGHETTFIEQFVGNLSRPGGAMSRSRR